VSSPDTWRGYAVLMIGMRLGRTLVPPLPADLERAVKGLAAHFRKHGGFRR
jgi:hypothetical protein